MTRHPLSSKPFLFLLAFLALSLFLVLTPSSKAGETLTLENYLQQVRSANRAVRASEQNAQGANERRNESNVMYLPQFFSNATFAKDEKPPSNPAFMGTRTDANSFSLGVSQLTSFGLSGKLSYQLDYLWMVGAMLPMNRYHTGTPKLELNQSLLKNGFGSETRAQFRLLEAGAKASHYGEKFKSKAQLFEAEATYWRLALARETHSMLKEMLKGSEQIYEWASRRARLNLADRSDMLQARAALESRLLEVQSAQDEERAARLAFNELREVPGDQVDESLLEPKKNVLEDIQLIGVKPDDREDVKAAEATARAASANADLSRERNKPNLDVFALYALNSKERERADAIQNSLKTQFETKAIGVKFSMPMDFFGYQSGARKGYALERDAADLLFQKKAFDVQQEWNDLSTKLGESRKRLRMFQTLEATQKEKLEHERNRFSRGRTTTYQVLLFQQDYALSRLSRIRTEGEILRILSQMKLFSSATTSLEGTQP